LVQRVDVSSTASASLEDFGSSEAGENESEHRRGASEIALRPIGTKQAKRRKLDVLRDSTIAKAFSSIAEYQLKRLEESKRRNIVTVRWPCV
jgi:hypothetical protein